MHYKDFKDCNLFTLLFCLESNFLFRLILALFVVILAIQAVASIFQNNLSLLDLLSKEKE